MLTPKKPVDRSQAYCWTRRWWEAEKEPAEGIKAGRVNTYDLADELSKGLDEK